MHEGAEPSGLVHNVRAGLQVKVIRVGEDGLSAGASNHFGDKPLHVRFCANRDECRGADVAVRRVDYACSAQPAAFV